MSWTWLIVALLIGFGAGTYLGFGYAVKKIKPGDQIHIKKAKNKRGIFDLTNIFTKKKKL